MDALILWLPLLALIIFVLYRIIFVYIVRRKILKHARIVYEYSLRFLHDHKYEILTLRHAFYDGVMQERKVYKEYLQALEKILKGQDKVLDKSLRYLMTVSL